jgi:hypothetical protein
VAAVGHWVLSSARGFVVAGNRLAGVGCYITLSRRRNLSGSAPGNEVRAVALSARLARQCPFARVALFSIRRLENNFHALVKLFHPHFARSSG